MENKKSLFLAIVVILVLILGIVLIVSKASKPKQSAQPVISETNVSTQEKPAIAAKDNEVILPTVEMGNAIGEVQSIASDSVTVKTDKETITLTIKGPFNVSAFVEKGVEQKKISDIKVGSKVSVQYSKDKVVMSMYLMK